MQVKKRAAEVNARLKQRYPLAKTPLLHQNPFQLLVATILSAQCTDKQVNKVTPALFARYQSPADFAGADLNELERLIYSTGFYKNKAQNIKAAAEAVHSRFNDAVPADMTALTSLPGVGRKTANVVLTEAFGAQGAVVDTHVGRLARRLGFTKENDPVKVEYALMALLPPVEWSGFCLRLIFLGREICLARKPHCDICLLKDLCPYAAATV